MSRVQCVRWHSRQADQQRVVLRRSGSRRGLCVFLGGLLSFQSLCSAGEPGYVTSCIIIRGRARPSASRAQCFGVV